MACMMCASVMAGCGSKEGFKESKEKEMPWYQ